MILVLSDDFSGAAEMAGIARSLGFSAEIHTSPRTSSNSEVVAIDAHTRGLNKKDAIAQLEGMMPVIKDMQASWIFKKVDSVLRGHVLAESATIMRCFDQANGMLISVNPSKKRVIRGGNYFIHDTPLHQTMFARDPAFPATTSNVMELLGSSDDLEVLSYQDKMEPKDHRRLIVPDVSLPEEVNDWAKKLPFDSLAAGGVDFFSSLLKHRHQHDSNHHSTQRDTTPLTRLMICGSHTAIDSGRIEQCHHQGWAVHLLPEAWMSSDDPVLLNDWCARVWEAMQHSRKCMVGMDGNHVSSWSDPSHPACRLVKAVHILCRHRTVDQMLVEGGETAHLLVCSFGQDRFKVVYSSQEGVPELLPCETPLIRIVPKPGSYPWPDEFLED
ncbi:MAG: hypothetical protein HOM65_18525 [Verrucomicrobia bacterium]|nr:hypothetical protein [Verrucomicrobiota bacterium]